MTIPTERSRAVVHAEQFLQELTNPRLTPRVPREIRQRALRILRHYPSKWDINCAAETSPDLFGEFPETVND